jgi:uncharacterized protein (TIGR03000 family)
MLPPPLPTDNRARVRVLLPADARLWVNGAAMTQTGPERTFTTPVLTPGEAHRYEIKAQWLQGGKPVEQALEVEVRANKATTVDFNALLARN